MPLTRHPADYPEHGGQPIRGHFEILHAAKYSLLWSMDPGDFVNRQILRLGSGVRVLKYKLLRPLPERGLLLLSSLQPRTEPGKKPGAAYTDFAPGFCAGPLVPLTGLGKFDDARAKASKLQQEAIWFPFPDRGLQLSHSLQRSTLVLTTGRSGVIRDFPFRSIHRIEAWEL